MTSQWDKTAAGLGYASEEALWAALYTKEGLSISALAARFFVTPGTIRSRLVKKGVKRRGRGGDTRHSGLPYEKALEIKKIGISLYAKSLGVPYRTVHGRVQSALRRKQKRRTK